MDWKIFTPASCLPDCWCEAPRVGSYILEPVNTWTNLIFVFMGLFLIFFNKKIPFGFNFLSIHRRYSRIYGLALIFLGFGSFLFHASQTLIGQWFDVFGMYLVTTFFAIYNFIRLKLLKPQSFLFYYLISCTFLGLIIYLFPDTRRWLFGVLLFLIVFQIIYTKLKLNSVFKSIYLVISISTYSFGQFLWYLDKSKIWCHPYALMNGHGLWHLLTGISAMTIFLYFASEKVILTENHPSTHA